MKVDASNFQTTVEKTLQNFMTDDVVPNMERAIKEAGRTAAKKLKTNSPQGTTGKYAKGWTFKAKKERLTVEGVVYGKSGTYQLAHLINNSHAKRNGERWTPPARLQHIAPVEKEAVEEVTNNFIRYMGGD